ncbi:dihydroorotate oxidase A [Loktanella atrilutea]|uniref:Dihydroorotate dehydrogenase (quinone) n=1 Tax=Loktanella atrilutea TaxID=366533 RepID=A0A1M5B1S0_LOKAT|nr:quinone-dependent dihydroorotate dehydrogenase [Loktanella atrilutea]SHF36415.1 dihydroorotate oxidase A [Loktanella atrilutea]
MYRHLEDLALLALQQIDPERAHGLALQALNMGLGPSGGPVTSPRLRTTVAGLDLPNPVGLAAGFDKNAVALRPLARCGFGFIEVGAATPRPQEGNPKPRLFRLTEDGAAINRFGFNNDGAAAIARRLKGHAGIVGLNLGANKDSVDRAGDFARVLTTCGDHVDFATVNVSSPNTERLRDLQGKAALSALLSGVMRANRDLARPVPVFLKIAPDLSEAEIADLAEVAEASGIAALIATNTTVARDGLHGPHRDEKGGLSGQPLFDRSTRVVARIAGLTRLPIIGVGGVASAEQAYQKIRAGASAVQLYTGLVYGGIRLATEIAQGMDDLLARDGHASVADAVGSGRADWI